MPPEKDYIDDPEGMPSVDPEPVLGAAPAPEPEDVNDFLEDLGLPEDMAEREPEDGPNPQAVLEEFESRRKSQRFLIGLAIAILGMVEETLAAVGQESEPQGLSAFTRKLKDNRGRDLNTLSLLVGDDDEVGIRRFYNLAEGVITNKLRRFDYPNAAPHATQSWERQLKIIDGLFACTPGERRTALDGFWAAVVEMRQFAKRTIADALPRPFVVTLEKFPNTQKGEPAGAVLQGLAFAYYRADSPNVTIETGKVGAGSNRTGRVGDIDGWNGSELVLSIEVKDRPVSDADDTDLGSFLANLREWPDATAIVLAKDATEEAIAAFQAQDISLLTRLSLVDAVRRWDLNKQRLAAREFQYYLGRVQRNTKLIERYEKFLEDENIQL